MKKGGGEKDRRCVRCVFAKKPSPGNANEHKKKPRQYHEIVTNIYKFFACFAEKNTNTTMRRKKIYGHSRLEKCPLCGDPGIHKNKQGLPVCRDHKEYTIRLTCACGEELEARQGRYGTFFTCMNCGTISWHKAMMMNNIT